MKKYTDYVLDRAGNAVAGAQVYVRKQIDSTLATLYSDDGVTTTSNPVTTDNDGEFSFYAADDTYKLQVFVDGVEQQEVDHFQHFDETEFLKADNDLSDLNDAPTALTNLGVSSFAQTVLDDADAAAVRTTIGLGTIATQAASSVAITGGAISGITDLAVADGGTGASSASAARTNLGLGTIATFNETTSGQYAANTSGKALSTDKVWSAADTVALTDAATVAVDMSTGINFSVTLGGNRTLGAHRIRPTARPALSTLRRTARGHEPSLTRPTGSSRADRLRFFQRPPARWTCCSTRSSRPASSSPRSSRM
jgi:hypothetical protein